MKISRHHSEKLAGIFDSLSSEGKSMLRSVLDHGFDGEAASELVDEGIAEEQRIGATEVEDYPGLRFIPSSLQDLELFAEPKVRSGLKRALRALPRRIGSPACVVVPGRDGQVLRRGPYRIAFRIDKGSRSIIVLGIGCWACNPMLKVWRYLDQAKAVDLIQSSKLYFRRADLLEDEYEATPTMGNYVDYRTALSRAFRGDPDPNPSLFEAHRHCAYVCCWRASPHESWLAWKLYCSRRGGCALQTTWRKLSHLYTRLKRSDEVHCRKVSYISHRRDEIDYEGLGDEAFYKALWFSDEHEIRLVRFRNEYFCVAPEDLKASPGRIPKCQRIRCDLTSFLDGIVVNPFASQKQKEALTKLLKEHQSALAPKVRQSEILTPPVGRP